MKAIPILKCSNMNTSLFFYTNVLDFKLKYKSSTTEDWVVNLKNGGAEIQLSIHAGDGAFGNAINFLVSDVDALYKKYLSRGLDVSIKKDSPVHQAPLNQTWGTREFYVNDPDGNTLRFFKPI